ncbi:signal peptidase I [Staphylococcus chromogenes]|nr:signal peptidase I [Staphylococcus chromogenes]
MGRTLARTGMAILFAFLALCALAFGSGFRTYVLSTPSMGTALPVGTMVVTQPAQIEQLNEGDIITYRVAEHMTRTHRVVSHTSTTAITKGDLNGSPDPIPVEQKDLVGRVVFSWNTGGWVMKILPFLAGGWLLMYLASQRVHTFPERSRYRSLGVFCGLALALTLYKPLFGVEMLTMKMDGQGKDSFATVHAVSTGLLPIQLEGVGEGGTSTPVLQPTGADGYAEAHTPSDKGKFEFRPKPVFNAKLIGILLVAILAPYVWFFALNRWHKTYERRVASVPAGGQVKSHA